MQESFHQVTLLVSILILLDYLFLLCSEVNFLMRSKDRLNPYFIGLPILISPEVYIAANMGMSQSLFYWITYSYLSFFVFSFLSP